MIIRTCKHCGKQYKTYPSIKLLYCSRECSNKGKILGSYDNCVQCGKEFYKHRSDPNKKFCSISCGMTFRNLTDQNPSYKRDISGSKNPMYGRKRTGKDNPMFGKTREQCVRWKGGRKVRKDGYVVIAVPDDYPNPCDCKTSGTKYALEHRVNFEKHIGRYLEPSEVIHHIDGNPSNNNIENLQLFSSQSEHVSIGHGSS